MIQIKPQLAAVITIAHMMLTFLRLLGLLAATLPVAASALSEDSSSGPSDDGCGPGCLLPGSRMPTPDRRSEQDTMEVYVKATNPILILERSTYWPLNCPNPNATSQLILATDGAFSQVPRATP